MDPALLFQKGSRWQSDLPPDGPPLFKKRPHNFSITPEWFQYPRGDFYSEYDRGEKVGHLCRPQSGTAVMHFMGHLPRQPVETIRVPRTRPKTVLAVTQVRNKVPWIRVPNEETGKPVWNRPKSAPCLRRNDRTRNMFVSEPEGHSPHSPTHDTMVEKSTKRPASAVAGGRRIVREQSTDGKQRPKSAVITRSTSAPRKVETVHQFPNNEDGGGNIDIDVKVERLQGFGGNVPGEIDNYGLVRLRERPPHIFQALPKDPSMRNPPGHREDIGAMKHVQVPENLKNRYVRAFAKSCTRPPVVSYYERRKTEKERRKKMHWRGPNEFSYKPPLKAPCPCPPRKGIHPEAGLSWFPAPHPGELGEKFASYADQEQDINPNVAKYGMDMRKTNKRRPASASCSWFGKTNRNAGPPPRGSPIRGNRYKEYEHQGECSARAYGTSSLSFHALDNTRRRHHMLLLVDPGRHDCARSMKIPPHIPTLDV